MAPACRSVDRMSPWTTAAGRPESAGAGDAPDVDSPASRELICASCSKADAPGADPMSAPRPFDTRRTAWALVALAATAGAVWLMQTPGFADTCAAIALVVVAIVVFLAKVLEAAVF